MVVCCVTCKGAEKMRKTLEDLYYGNIIPHEKRIQVKSELQRMVSRAAECENRLAELLNDEGKNS